MSLEFILVCLYVLSVIVSLTTMILLMKLYTKQIITVGDLLVIIFVSFTPIFNAAVTSAIITTILKDSGIFDKKLF